MLQPKRYIARNGELYCPHCNGLILTDLIDGNCPLCRAPIDNSLPPVGLNCNNKDCYLYDYIIGCKADKLCNKNFLL